jgi:hypothetical protein
MGLLHRPTFESSLASGLHLIDHSFGSIVLAVCALASRLVWLYALFSFRSRHFRYSDDPRVVLGGTNSKLSSGWEWFQQINPARDFFLTRTLHDLQRIFVSKFMPIGKNLIYLGVSFRFSICRAQARRNLVGIWLLLEYGRCKIWVYICANATMATIAV